MAVRVGINGFGRIGRNILRAGLQRDGHDLEFVAVNDLTDADTLAHLLKYDSVHGHFPGEVRAGEGEIRAGDATVRVLSEPEPGELPWDELDVDVVLEATGRFRNREQAAEHLSAGADKVIITAPATGPDISIVMGVNQDEYDPGSHDVLSNASCTTNCVAPPARVLLEEFGFESGLINTVHSYTTSQNLLDGPHKDLRRARAAAVSVVPTSTGAAKATAEVIPELKGKFDGMAMRVPTPDVSVTDLVVNVETDVTAEEVNRAFRSRAEGDLEGILAYSEEPLVSVDYTGHPASSIIDARSTEVMGDRMVRVLAWYDNEWGYSNRCLDLTSLVGERLGAASTA